jgi:multidrug efflux pump subunit AcrA (membrane-fusion protein)
LAPVESASILPERSGIAAQIYRSAAEASDQKMASASLWVPSAEAAALKVGQRIDLSSGHGEFPATVAAVKPAVQAGAPSEVLLTVSDQEAKLRVGDFLQARLGQDDARRREATIIPASAVVESVRGSFVYAANGGAFLRTPVVLGSRQGDRIEVVDGLFEGDEIVTAGASALWMIELQAVNGGKGCADGH